MSDIHLTWWRPIAEAPKGKAVLICEPGCGMAVAKQWADGSWRCDMGGFMHPTHWMDLPAWPEQANTRGKAGR